MDNSCKFFFLTYILVADELLCNLLILRHNILFHFSINLICVCVFCAKKKNFTFSLNETAIC